MVRTKGFRKALAALLFTAALATGYTLTSHDEPSRSVRADTSWGTPTDTSWGSPGSAADPAASSATPAADRASQASGDTSWG